MTAPLVIYEVTTDLLGPNDDHQVGLYRTLAGARRAALRHMHEHVQDAPETLEEIQPWWENGQGEDSPSYACEYPVGPTTYYIGTRTVEE